MSIKVKNMTRAKYYDLKEKYIYKIMRSTGLISTKAIDGNSYLFRSTDDKGYSEYIKVNPGIEEFLKLVIADAKGEVLKFVELVEKDGETKVVNEIEVNEDTSTPKPVPVDDLERDIEELKRDIIKFQPDTTVVYGFEDYDGKFHSY